MLDIGYVCSYIVEGPFFLGDTISRADVMMAPWMDRMFVLEYFRNFTVPKEGKGSARYYQWHAWRRVVLDHPAVKPTREPKEKLIEHYKKYVDHTCKDKYYEKYYRNFKMDRYKEEEPDPETLEPEEK